MLYSWVCPFLCNIFVIHPVCFHGCLIGIAIQEKRSQKIPLMYISYSKLDRNILLLFYCCLSVFFSLYSVRCCSFAKQNISLTWLSKTNGFSWTLIGNIAGKKIPTSKWPTVIDIYLFSCWIVKNVGCLMHLYKVCYEKPFLQWALWLFRQRNMAAKQYLIGGIRVN